MSVVRHATISPGLPAGPRDPLPGAAWREVTVLHVDVAGVTPSERIAPETVAPVMSERLTAVIAIAAAWGGIVDGCAGGCASIVFSLPHPGLQRATAGVALEAALEMHGRLGDVAAPWRDALAERRPRISIASGPCVVGTLVCNTLQFSTAIGPAVDAARWLQASAAPGAIVCDHATWLLIHDCVLGRRDPEVCAAAGEPRRYEISGFSSCARPWPRVAAAMKYTATAAVIPSRVLRREGDYWTILCGESAFHFKDSKGFRSLARLLATPHAEIHVLELAGVIADHDARHNAAFSTGCGADLVHHETAGPVLDYRAKAEYRERLRELDQEIDEAQRWADAGRAARAEAEKRALARQLAAALGFGGRDRKLPSLSERARVNLTRTIRAAIDSIATSHPDLGGHLRASIRTGTFCSYSPPPGVSGDWRVE